MKRGKEVYEKIEIPAELTKRVDEAIASVDRAEAEKKARAQRRSRKLLTLVKATGTLAAAFVVCLTLGVNTSQAFAKEVGGLPLIGTLARVLTVRSYSEKENSVELYVEVPGIAEEGNAGESGSVGSGTEGLFTGESGAVGSGTEGLFTGEPGADGENTGSAAVATGSYVADINVEIDRLVDEFVAKSKQDMADYKEAFFETGGTEEEWNDRTMDVHVTYEVKYQSGPYLSLVLHAEEAWVASYQENVYYNLNLETQKDITLEDLLGPDYIEICNESIVAQINEQIKEDEEKIYFGYGPNADELDKEIMFTTITPETNFYINAEGNPVICFEKYEIAPGYMGVCEFEILQ